MANKNEVKEGMFFKIAGDNDRYAFQVTELWPNVMVCAVGDGCMSKPYNEWELLEDTSKCQYVYHASYFEDNVNQ